MRPWAPMLDYLIDAGLDILIDLLRSYAYMSTVYVENLPTHKIISYPMYIA